MRDYLVFSVAFISLIVFWGCASAPTTDPSGTQRTPLRPADISKMNDLGFFRLPLVRESASEKPSSITLDGGEVAETVFQKFNMPVGVHDITYMIQDSILESRDCQGEPATLNYVLNYSVMKQSPVTNKYVQLKPETKFVFPAGSTAMLVATIHNPNKCTHLGHSFLMISY